MIARVSRVLGVLAMLSWAGGAASAAQPRPAPSVRSPASSVLDAWIVTRYRGAQLEPHASANAPVAIAAGARPRVEAVRAGTVAFDTVIAVHFASRLAAPALSVDARPQLAGPVGSLMPLPLRIIERRAFRAPRLPGPVVRPDSGWRYGWAYLALIPKTAGRSAARYRGWMLVDAPAAR